MALISLSRQTAIQAEAITRLLAAKLDWPWYNRRMFCSNVLGPRVDEPTLDKLIHSPKRLMSCPADFGLSTVPDADISYRESMLRLAPAWLEERDAVLLACGGTGFANLMTNPREQRLSVRLTASRDLRVNRLCDEAKVSQDQAAAMLNRDDNADERYYRTLFDTSERDPELYDLMIRMDLLTTEGALDVILTAYRDRAAAALLRRREAESRVKPIRHEDLVLKNETEVAFAELLDMYHIAWRYEPQTYPVAWDDDGRVTMAFSPDFYLIDYDLYLELTTMDQAYVTAKNRKARLVQDLYGVNVRIVYKRDFEYMIERLIGTDDSDQEVLG